MHGLKLLIAIVLSFTIGAMAVEIRAVRESRDLAVQAECAYHEGYNEGYRDHAHETERNALGVIVRDLPDGAQEIVPTPIDEDSPAGDCHTMGNRKCGPPTPDHHSRSVIALAL